MSAFGGIAVIQPLFFGDRVLNVRFHLLIQPVDATHSANFSAGE
jgi:hypothetical protein